MENEKSNKSKKCCYLYCLCDLVCFVFGSLLLSLAIFGNCTAGACGSCCGCLGYLGLPLIALGLVIRAWTGRGCCDLSACSTSKSDS